MRSLSRCFLLQIHYRFENARRDRVYGKPITGARVDTSELADRVSTVAFSRGTQ